MHIDIHTPKNVVNTNDWLVLPLGFIELVSCITCFLFSSLQAGRRRRRPLQRWQGSLASWQRGHSAVSRRQLAGEYD